MELEVMLSTMNLKNKEEMKKLINQMKITTPVVIINQITEKIPLWDYQEKNIRLYSFPEKGLSKSRNRAMHKLNKDIGILADDDVQYRENYKQIILDAYHTHPDADIIAFYVETKSEERKIKKQKNHKVNWVTAMRIQSPQITFRMSSIQKQDLQFNETFRFWK